jgi:thiamine-monophosphate kinase
VSEDAKAMNDGRPALLHALGDGEDFELAFAVAPEDGRRLVEEQLVRGITLSVVGECVAERGLWLEEGGQRRQLAALGWVHEMD